MGRWNFPGDLVQIHKHSRAFTLWLVFQPSQVLGTIYSFIADISVGSVFPERAQTLPVESTLTTKHSHCPFPPPEPLSNIVLEESSPSCVCVRWCFSHGYFFAIDLTCSWQKPMATSAPCGWVTHLWWCSMGSKLWRTVSPLTQRMFRGDYRPTFSMKWQMERVRC